MAHRASTSERNGRGQPPEGASVSTRDRGRQRRATRAVVAAFATLLFAATVLQCGGAGFEVEPPRPPAPLAKGVLVREVPARAATPLAFPPPPETRRVRGDLDGVAGVGPFRVLAPELDAEGRFALQGATLRVALSAPVAEGLDPANAFRLTPAVKTEARWLNRQTLELTALEGFEPGEEYALELVDVRAAGGEVLGKPFAARFVATPSITVAGKVLSYLPKAGEERVIALHPQAGGTVGTSPALAVVYDQPIDLRVAAGLVELRDAGGRPVPTALAHPTGKAFQGVELDPRLVVLVRPTRALSAGEGYVLVARHRAQPVEEAARHDFAVATPFELVRIGCGYGGRYDRCEARGQTLVSSEREIFVAFNHAIAERGAALARAVVVSPPVPNLSVEAWGWSDDGRLRITGAFEPSRHYHVRVAPLHDTFGGRLPGPLEFTLEMRPLEASSVMPEGVLFLDADKAAHFPLTTRNVAEALITAWPVPGDDAAAYREALQAQADRARPSAPGAVQITVAVQGARDALVTTEVDLGQHLARGQSYLAVVETTLAAYGAELEGTGGYGGAPRPPTALVRLGLPDGLAVHARSIPAGDAGSAEGTTVVHVARLATGEPVAGASVELLGAQPMTGPATDASGMSLVPRAATDGALVRVEAGGERVLLPVSRPDATGAGLFRELTGGTPAAHGDLRAFVTTDRGIYRPGSSIGVRVSAFAASASTGALSPLAGGALQVRALGPTGDVAWSAPVGLDDLGGAAVRFEVEPSAKIGRYELRLERAEPSDEPLARSTIQIAEFEPPRFAVDVALEAPSATTGVAGRAVLRGTLKGRYLFGAPMAGAVVDWSIHRSAAELGGPLSDAGLRFRPESYWLDDEEEPASGAERSGRGVLAANGSLVVEQPLDLRSTTGPQRYTLEASVADESGRSITGRGTTTVHPASRYAGVRLGERWVDTGSPLAIELGVADTAGRPVGGVPVSARIERVEWAETSVRGGGGALEVSWRPRYTEVARCRIASELRAAPCTFTPRKRGEYRVHAEVDGRRGGAVWFYAFGSDPAGAGAAPPSRGNVVALQSDKARYAPGDTARLLVQSPYPGATAILTVEQGKLLATAVKRGNDRAFVFEVPVEASYAPYVHAVVTLLPEGATGADMASYRIGALRVPVSLAGARLAVEIESDKARYAPGEEATVTVRVKDGALPEAHAEIALSAVDEGVLRLTGFEAIDPAASLHPARPLAFALADSRTRLGELYASSHVAGDGGGELAGTIGQTRKDFVATALWEPLLRTDAAGEARMRFKLPDNLTEFRLAAVAVDAEGKGGRARQSFVVQKPVLVEPVLPRFAYTGDELEVAAMLHNTTDQPFTGTLELGSDSAPVTLPAGARLRVGFQRTMRAGQGTFSFALRDAGGEVVDRVEKSLPVGGPGMVDAPRLDGAFVGEQIVALALPEDLVAESDATLVVRAGEHLWPELGRRLEFLLGYPHGCVEQTTSSTLPLIAARNILPRIGADLLSKDELDARIRSGIARLATMRTASGGLAYWPGGSDPNVYGTSYAIRAVIRAGRLGIDAPRGMLDGMRDYLVSHMFDEDVSPEVVSSIAESLGELEALDASTADALWDRREKNGFFGRASLAIALSGLPGQDARVAELADELEAALAPAGKGLGAVDDDFRYYGSHERTEAAVAIALGRLRPRSQRLPALYRELAGGGDSYTTQAAAFSLLALSDELERSTAAGLAPVAELDGAPLPVARDLGFGAVEYRVLLASLRGRKATLRLVGARGEAVGYMVSARYQVPFGKSAAGSRSLAGTSAANGPDVFRVFTDAKGVPIDLAGVHVGDVVRVALLVRLPDDLDARRRGYLAISDALPAGFEPVDPDLATVASVPDIGPSHPFADVLRYGATPSHLELRDDAVVVYFDELWDDKVAVSYLARATTPGRFALPPPSAELMYEGGSIGYGEDGVVIVR